MADDSKSFFQTIPGVLTAMATVLTAITGLIIALNQIGFFQKSPQATPVSSTSTIAAPVVTAPTPLPRETVASGLGAGADNSNVLAGVWLNSLIDPRNGRPDSRLVIRRLPDGTHIVQGWGNCEPKECDWGVAALKIVAGDSKTDLIGLRATTKLVHVVPSKNREEVTYLTLEGTGAPNSLTVHRRFESYDNGQLASRIEKILAFTRQGSGPKE